jgi:hypothetical protein
MYLLYSKQIPIQNYWPEKKILAEVQLHLFNIFDGTLLCPNGYNHKVYEIVRALDLNEPRKIEFFEKTPLASKSRQHTPTNALQTLPRG